MTLPVSGFWLAVVAAITGLVCGVLLYRTLSHLLRRLVLRRRFLRGAQGEKDAQAFLSRHGYRIVEVQARREVRMVVDGAPVTYEVRADFIAEKRGRTYVVEVKTGVKAIDPVSTDTRRQLLEYALAYGADGIRLFDADAGELHEVELPITRGKGSGGKRMLFAGMAAGVMAAVLTLWVTGMITG